MEEQSRFLQLSVSEKMTAGVDVGVSVIPRDVECNSLSHRDGTNRNSALVNGDDYLPNGH
jgi:hypothetical protein